MFERTLQASLTAAWRQFPAVVVTGARQVGKTTLARLFLPAANYVTLDLPANAESTRLNPRDFFGEHAAPLILDEVQYAPTLFRYLKTRIDANRTPGQYLLTGSQSFELMAGVTESLAGRVAILTLPALTLTELPNATDLAAIDDFLWRGSYPELWQRPELDRTLWLSSYLATYLERDVRNLLNVGNLRDFDRFLRACALRAGQLLSYTDLARDVGIAVNTARSWISVLEASQQIFLLEPYHRQRTKRLVKSPKLYFTDTGMLSFLMGFSQPSELTRHASWGAVWENFVINEVRKSFLVRGVRPPLWFWRTLAGDEIDLLVEIAPERFIVIESKAATQVDGSVLKPLRALQSEYGDDSIAHAYVACRTDRAYPLQEGGRAEAVPIRGPMGLLARPEFGGGHEAAERERAPEVPRGRIRKAKRKR